MLRLALSVSIALFGTLPLAGLSKEPVPIAFSAPLSGPFANFGEVVLRHAQLYVEGVNARGGVLGGRPLELVPFDNKNSPQEGMLQLSQIADRGIRFVSFCCASHIAVPMSEALERHNSREPERRMLFLASTGDQEITNEKCSFWSFAFQGKAEMMMAALTGQLARQPGIKRVYLINQDYPWGQQNQRFAREMLARQRPDIEIVGDDLHPLGKVKDFAPYVAKIRAARPDIVITANWGNDLTLLVKAAGESRLRVSFYTYFGSLYGAATVMGDAALDRVVSVWRWHPNLPIETERLAREEYQRRYGGEYYLTGDRLTIEMLAAAIDQARSTDPLRVAYALEGLRLQGSTGEVWMRPDDHQLLEPLFVLSLTKVNGRDVKVGIEGTQTGTRTLALIEAADTAVPTRCEMKRPPRP
ncbi:MAG TPA: branched-chain amino acid ABC transporter substrate-binding protein [Burkholderiales bacterium]|jgi:branched-chain amino acid transport system substrate-binding protein